MLLGAGRLREACANRDVLRVNGSVVNGFDARAFGFDFMMGWGDRRGSYDESWKLSSCTVRGQVERCDKRAHLAHVGCPRGCGSTAARSKGRTFRAYGTII